MSKRKVKIKFESFSKSFGDLLVLDNLNFEVYENEFLCIVGPTGCGKTTLANVVCGLLPPTKGRITIDGEEVNPQKHNISFVFQESSAFPWRTVWDNIKLGLEIKGFPKDEIVKRVSEVIELLGLKGFEHLYPHQISGGMKQRVDIARSFCSETDLMLMDEPFGQNDEKTRFHLENQLIEIWQKKRRTIIFVTHNLEEAVYLAERIIVFTQKPTTIKDEVIVDLPRPRDFSSPQFVEIRNKVTELVKWW
ncbi:ABC transporter ATP-binding protein [Desulfofundulus sp. TPOSR]|uniref:ABC transporter ATP-binding protein n=1 Tax=Desulfofundulus sp. TPOSR TaxID=2714340 RepID=UPI0014078A00|nr:ABC transporter ATP-binding protein [Desulfofundulus sp. TPOSR]NHM28762.1 ABC transporter ATP-binding protein [Desulfofundulus sp. TPOSR]